VALEHVSREIVAGIDERLFGRVLGLHVGGFGAHKGHQEAM